MKIQKVKIKEFKVIHDLEKDINGANILLLGDNGVGKSSFIQFIEIALGKNTNIPPNAMGEGEVITDKNGNQYTFKVKLKDGKAVVTVTTPDGMKDSRKGAIAGIVGAMEFDIDEFVELSKTVSGRKKQVEIFKSFLPEEIRLDLSRFEANVKANYDERTELNRVIKEREGAILSNPLRNENLDSFNLIEVSSEMSKLKEAQAINDKIKEGIAKKESILKEIESANTEILDAEKKLLSLREAQSKRFEKIETATAWLAENPLRDTDVFEKTISSATETNTKYNSAQTLKEQMTLVEKMKEEAGELTAKIGAERGAIEIAIREMDSPISGLSFDEEQLVYNDIPVNPDSLSTSEIMELGIRLKMAENPELGILFIQRGESLGAARLKEIQSIADKAGWQIIMEQVQRGNEQLTVEIMQA